MNSLCCACEFAFVVMLTHLCLLLDLKSDTFACEFANFEFHELTS